MSKDQVIRAKVARAFRALRRKGFFARANFWCCSSCALAAIPEGVTDYAFYHHQDTGTVKAKGVLHVRHGGDSKAVALALQEQGLAVSWNGTSTSTIQVALDFMDITRYANPSR